MKLSEHFGSNEFACRCCGQVHPDGVDMELVMLLEAIREKAGGPVTIISGYRCPRHNKNVGGARSSQHMLGTAADIKILGVSPKEVGKIAGYLLLDKGGIGIYPTFTHVDVRRNKARW